MQEAGGQFDAEAQHSYVGIRAGLGEPGGTAADTQHDGGPVMDIDITWAPNARQAEEDGRGLGGQCSTPKHATPTAQHSTAHHTQVPFLITLHPAPRNHKELKRNLGSFGPSSNKFLGAHWETCRLLTGCTGPPSRCPQLPTGAHTRGCKGSLQAPRPVRQTAGAPLTPSPGKRPSLEGPRSFPGKSSKFDLQLYQKRGGERKKFRKKKKKSAIFPKGLRALGGGRGGEGR